MDSEIPLTIRLGILAPPSNFIPFLAGDLIAALKFGLAEAQIETEIIIGSAGYNANEKLLTPAIQQLILNDRADCVIAPLNISLIEKIAGQFEGQAIPLIALNLTEDPLPEKTPNQFIFISDFHLWQTAWMSGYLAGKKFGSSGAALVALHEGGYNLMFAFQLGLEAAGGSLIVGDVTHRNTRDEDPTEAIRRVAAHKSDFIWAAYSGKEAVSFARAYAAENLSGEIPLITIPTMITPSIRKNADGALDNFWFVEAAAQSLDSALLNPLADALGRSPNPYALLAYESARLIGAAAKQISGERDWREHFPSALAQAEFSGPRGSVKFNDDSAVKSPFFLKRIIGGEDRETEKFAAPPQLAEQYALARRKIGKQGWINPFLCA